MVKLKEKEVIAIVVDVRELQGKKVALVLSGGGARGAYQIGVWKALKDLGVDIDIVTGISVGALNGAFVAQDDLQQAIEMWNNLSTSDILDYQIEDDLSTIRGYSKNLTALFIQAIKQGGISSKPMTDLVEEYLDDEQGLQNLTVDFGVVVTNTETRREESYFLNNLAREDIKRLLVASASLYPIMEMTDINDKPYADGGYRNHIPINLAMEKNPDFVIAVDLQPESNVQLPYNHEHILIIESQWYLGDIMTFDINRNRSNLKLGYNDLMKAFGKYFGKLYTFTNPGNGYKRHLAKYLSALESGTTQVDVSTFIKSNKNFLKQKLEKEWGHIITDDNFHIALLEVTGRLFYYPAQEPMSFADFIQRIIKRIGELYDMDKHDALDKLQPDFFLGHTEWYEYYSQKLSLFPEQQRIFYFIDLLTDSSLDLSNWVYHILFKIDPVPFSIALFINYLTKNEKKLSQIN